MVLKIKFLNSLANDVWRISVNIQDDRLNKTSIVNKYFKNYCKSGMTKQALKLGKIRTSRFGLECWCTTLILLHFRAWDQHSWYPIVEFTTSFFSTHRVPEVLQSDNGPPFNSQAFAEFAEESGFKHRRITPLYMKAQDQVTNFNKLINKTITDNIPTQPDRPWRMPTSRRASTAWYGHHCRYFKFEA